MDNFIRWTWRRPEPYRNNARNKLYPTSKQPCYRCGHDVRQQWHRRRCPARKASCYKCGKFGHFARKCFTKAVTHQKHRHPRRYQQNCNKLSKSQKSQKARCVNTRDFKQGENKTEKVTAVFKGIKDTGIQEKKLVRNPIHCEKAENSCQTDDTATINQEIQAVLKMSDTSEKAIQTTEKLNGFDNIAKDRSEMKDIEERFEKRMRIKEAEIIRLKNRIMHEDLPTTKVPENIEMERYSAVNSVIRVMHDLHTVRNELKKVLHSTTMNTNEKESVIKCNDKIQHMLNQKLYFNKFGMLRLYSIYLFPEGAPNDVDIITKVHWEERMEEFLKLK